MTRPLSGATGIEPGDGKAVLTQISFDPFMITAGRFVEDALEAYVIYPSPNCPPTGFIVVEPPMGSVGMKINIEMLL